MTKDEILEELNYKGKYTTTVKQRLKKLIKKYHPDYNKDDKETILLLYEVKKELENGTIEYKEEIKNKTSVKTRNSKEENSMIFFLESILDKLKQKRIDINKKISSLYESMNKVTDNKNNQQDKIYNGR